VHRSMTSSNNQRDAA